MWTLDAIYRACQERWIIRTDAKGGEERDTEKQRKRDRGRETPWYHHTLMLLLRMMMMSKCCIAVIQLYTYTCGNIVNTIMTNEHTSLEKYTPLTLYPKWLRKGYERFMCERWVGDWTNCNILTPSSFVFSSTSFSFCWAAQSGVLRTHSPLLGAGSLYSILSPTNGLQTNWTCLSHWVI